jgi:hypothetical protein
MVIIPIEAIPCKSFSFNTDVGQFHFRTYWSDFNSAWYLDLLGDEDVPLLAGIALMTGTNNLLAGTGIAQLDGCQLFMFDESGKGNRTFDGFGTTAKMYMTFPADGEVLPYG